MRNIINMIRLRISGFFRKHEDKIKDLGQKLIMVAMGVFIATIILSSSQNINNTDTSNNEALNVYKPTQTILKGSDVSKEQFEKDSNLVDQFLEFCNNKQVEEAYNLISDACKEEKYPTIEDFKKYYYNEIFEENRDYSLQALISAGNYNVYEIRYANNMLATGIYDSDAVYQDYITLNTRNNSQKISIGNFIDSEKCNVITSTQEIEATVVKKTTYMTYEEYEINIKNKMETTLLLSTLKNSNSIQLIAGSSSKYNCNMNKLFYRDLIIEPNRVETIKIAFKKNLSSDNTSKQINFSNIIKDYDTYKQNEEEYTEVLNVTIKLED